MMPLYKKPKTYQLLSFDTETFGKENRFLLGSVVFSENEYYVFEDKEEMCEFLTSRSLTDKKAQICFSTNLEFDIYSLFGNTEYEKYIIPNFRNSRLISCECSLNRLKFFDTINIAPFSVEKLGKIIGLEKMKTPSYIIENRRPSNEELDYVKKYNVNDALITLKFAQYFQDNLNSMNAKLKPTIASISLDFYKRNFLNCSIANSNKHNELVLNAYYGGRNEVINRGHFEDRLYYYDFNSLYPSVMLNEFPVPNSEKFKENGNLDIVKEYEGVSYVEMSTDKLNIPLLPVRTEKLIFPNGTIKGFYTHVEIRKALDAGYKIHKIGKQVYYTRTEKLFKDFVEFCYKKRLEMKKNNDNRELIFKLLMNSLYGKFAQKLETEEVISSSNMVMEEIERMVEEGANVRIVNDYVLIKKRSDKVPDFYIPIFSCYTTAFGRVKLFNELENLDFVVYYDTDSIVTDKKLNTSNELGRLKLEYVIDEAIFVKPKFYFFSSEGKQYSKVKGLPSRFNDITEFKEFLRAPARSYSTFTKFKTAIRKNKEYNKISEIVKKFELEDDKRKWENRFSLEPQSSHAHYIH